MAEPTIFTPEQAKRYSRNIAISQIGEKGQRKLLDAKVLLVGAGGLGSPAAIYLAAAGVGTLGIADPDVVDITNLQRQILHHNHDIGRPKVVSAAETIAEINPDVQVIQHRLRLSPENALKVLRPYDIVLDCSDNFPTRYLLNDACVMLGKPWVHGSIFAIDGQASTFVPGKGCYRCLYPMPSPPGMVPSSAVVGVLGAAPGIIGSIQVVETIKLILGLENTLSGRLLLYDALSMEFRQVKFRRNPNCPACGDYPTVTRLIDYEEFCGIPYAQRTGAASSR